MATIQKRNNTYTIRVSCGYDIKGKQIIKSMTYTPSKSMTQKQLEKELEKQAVLFEKKVREGVYLNSNITFSDFAKRWITDYAEKQLAPKTLQRYKNLLIRINEAIGHIKLEKLQPHHLLSFYNNLGEQGISNKYSYKASNDLIKLIKKDIENSIKITGSNERTLRGLIEGKTTDKKTANKIIKGLNLPDNSLFIITNENKVLTSSSISYYHRLISCILSTAVQWQVLFSNPCERVKPPKVIRKEPAYLDDIQAQNLVALLLKEDDIRVKTSILLLIYTGMRRGELCGLEWQDIDFNNNVINIRRASQYITGQGTITKEPKNESSIRALKQPQEVFNILKEYRAWQSQIMLKNGDRWHKKINVTTFNNGIYTTKEIKNDRVFTTYDGSIINPDTINFWLEKFREKHNLPEFSPHSLRHTNITLQIAAGVSLRTIAARAGHSLTSTTANIYSHAIKSADEFASQVLDDILTPKQYKQA